MDSRVVTTMKCLAPIPLVRGIGIACITSFWESSDLKSHSNHPTPICNQRR